LETCDVAEFEFRLLSAETLAEFNVQLVEVLQQPWCSTKPTVELDSRENYASSFKECVQVFSSAIYSSVL
jgi:hypothetical protein